MLNLQDIFKKLEDYVIIKFDKNLPKYNINDDVDILTSNIQKNKNIIINWYDKNIFLHKIININNFHIQLDLYKKEQDNTLHFRFDLFEKLHYTKFSLHNDIYPLILYNKLHNGISYVPCLSDDLSLRYCEYIEYIDIRPDKIKHLNYVNNYNENFYRINKGEHDCKLNYKNTSVMYNSIIVWGHGIEYILDILNNIINTINCEILNIKKGNINDYEHFIKNVYKLEIVNSNHIYGKTKYLKSIKNEYIHILIRNNGANIKEYGEGTFKVFADENIVNFKWKLREKYNPKLIDSNLQPSKNLPPGISHNHIIHITDSNEECIEVCKFVLNKNPKEFENKKIGNIYIPWHIRLPKTFKKKTVKIDKIFVTLANDKNKYKISDTPHYKYLNNDKEAYLNYYKKYMGIYIQDNHIPEMFDKLINNFNPNTYNLEDSRLIIILNNSVMDGCHRLAILQKNNITNINVFEINY
tara:strand:- start:2241 stop:3644 length:1404 start_codon:yes stop_codon:yes gene_type:complete